MVSLPNLIYGTAWKKEKTAFYVAQAIECGFRAIDTACQPKHYSEALVGSGLQLAFNSCKLKREDIFLQTKFTPVGGQDPQNMPYNPKDGIEKQILCSLEVSLKNLQTSYLDSLILHSPIVPYSEMKKAWQTLEQIYNQKVVKHIGISNCYEFDFLEKIYLDANVKPSFVQNRFYDQSGYDVQIRDFCFKNEIVYQSFWSLTANPHILATAQVQALAIKYSKTSAQIFFRFLKHIGITPLVGSTSKEHILQDLDIFSFELTKTEIFEINSLLK